MDVVRGSLVEAIVRENGKEKREGGRGDICFK
jgi:hypothetical protein